MTPTPESSNGPLPSDRGEPFAVTFPGQQELLQGALQQNPYIAIAIHDMKNQFAVIRGMAQLLERQVPRGQPTTPSALKSGLALIQRSVRKLQRQVDEFQDLSRIHNGEPIQFDPQPANLVSLIRACVEEITQETERAIRVRTTTEVLLGVWDVGRLERAVTHVLGNAVTYSAPAGVIYVSLSLDPSGGDHAVVIIRDEGVGIPPAELSQIFAPFSRGSNVPQHTRGSGLGLVDARAVIVQQGGTIQLKSTIGVGTTVTIRLPLSPAPVQPTIPEPAHSEPVR